ncbi:asparaginase [Cohnella herbarum]|uniref:Asparaginase n=1 Tax=Cohnella herbarum TaxID=2728023 RepID=A0A7Z2ZLW9_9BACL|nr:asparaginase [Cohnella herbarum]QJD84349.1 asparaginase [Cohnella herbarum]
MDTMNAPGDVPLVVMNRGELTENVHRGRISIVSAVNGKSIDCWGDVQALTYIRSTAKPIQALASLLDGAAEAYGFEDRHLALMTASHRGSRQQLAVLEEILALTGLEEDLLAIHPGMPIGRKDRDEWVASGGKPRKLFHTCAGKHLGVLAWSKLKGWPLEGYIHPEHPAQMEIIRRLKLWAGGTGAGVGEGSGAGAGEVFGVGTGADEGAGVGAGNGEGACAGADNVTVGKDGCGFPVAAIPLEQLGFAYGRLACPELGHDSETAKVVSRITGAMNAYPELVEGRNRLASILLTDANVVAKSGAHGVFTFGLRNEQLGVAIAVSNGTEIAWPHIVKAVLQRIGGISEETKRKLEQTFPTEFLNDVGEVAGKWQAVF